MNKLLFRCLDPETPDVGGTAQGGDVLDTAIEKAQDVSHETSTPESTPAPKFPWGNEDRRKTVQEIKDEMEIELGYEEEREGKKVPAKYSIKHIKEQAKWLNEHSGIIRAAVGMNKEFTANPDLAKAFNAFWQKSYNADGKVNVEYVQKMIGVLEGKQEQLETTIDDKTDDIKEMEQLLEELDPESPQAKIMRSNINGLKNTRAQLAETLKANKAMQDKLDGLDRFKTGFEQKQVQDRTAAEEQQAIKLFDTEFSSLTAKERKDGYHVDDADDAKDLERMVRDSVANMAAQNQITNDDQFVQAIRESVKAAFETISKRNERIINGYLQKKVPVKQGAAPVREKTKPESQGLDALDDLVDSSAAEVFSGQK